jgi:hypothetical protein
MEILIQRGRQWSLTGSETSPLSARMCARDKVYFPRKHFDAGRVAWFVSACVCYLLARWLSGRDSKEIFRIKLRAFAEDLTL